ncbi:MAG: hypothetical protein WD851_00030 [Pirellulales bacterium]
MQDIPAPKALAPMVVQYLVGLCCVRTNPESVDVILGDMVEDAAAAKPRDVDVTVTVKEDDGTLRAFKAYEVKREARPLDVTVVEQLNAKLRDMPAVTHRGIVSASGFTPAAIAKASAHEVELYAFQPWSVSPGDRMPSFQGEALPMSIGSFESRLLCWGHPNFWLYGANAPPTFTWTRDQSVCNTRGGRHAKYATIGAFIDELILRSTEILLSTGDAPALLSNMPLEPIAKEGQRQVVQLGRHTHTLDVSSYRIFLSLESRIVQIDSITITGDLQWETSVIRPQYYVMERVPDGVPFAGAAIAEYGTPDGKMCALTFAPGSGAVGVHPNIQLHEKHKNAIRQLKLALPTLAE